MNIHELTNEYLILQEMAGDPDVDEETLLDTMSCIEGELEDKVHNYGKVIKNIEPEIDGLDKEIERLTKMRDARKNNIKRMKENIFTMMVLTGKSKIKTDLFTFAIQKNGGKAPLVIKEGYTAEDVPEEFIKVKADIDTNKVREALEAGEILDWAYIGERGESLRMR